MENREKFKKIEVIVGKLFSKIGLTASQFTLLAILFAVISLYFLANNNLILTLPFFLLAVFLDFVDGAVARFLHQETKKGAYLDTICDRYVEGIILLGFLFLPLPNFILSPKVWIFLTFSGSLMTTYSKAAAKEKGLIEEELKKGLFGRAERMILILMAIIFGIFNLAWFLYPIIVLAVFSNITALQRIFLALSPGKS